MKIPIAPEALTVEWLTQALRESRTISQAGVISFDTELLGEGQSATGQLVQLRLTYDIEEADAPPSLIMKLSAADPARRASIHALLNMYGREVWFYQEIAGQVELQTPRCYYSDIDLETGECVLLLEDLSSARTLDKFGVCSLEEAELAIDQIARFHSTWWESPMLADPAWLADRRYYQTVQARYQQSWEPFLERVGATLPDKILEVGERMTRHGLTGLWSVMLEPPQTLTHTDYHLGNLLYLTKPSGDLSLVVLDWQLVRVGRALYDVALFLGRNLSPETRQAQEMALLRMYHTILVEAGVGGYSFDQCLHNYRLLMLVGLFRVVIMAGGGINIPDEQIHKQCNIVLPRYSAAIVDLDVDELLPK